MEVLPRGFTSSLLTREAWAFLPARILKMWAEQRNGSAHDWALTESIGNVGLRQTAAIVSKGTTVLCVNN